MLFTMSLTAWGKKSLLDAGWTEVKPGKGADYNFFKVAVEMPEG